MHQHSHYRGLRRRRERETGPEKIFEELIAENFPNMVKETVTQVEEVQRVPGRMNPRRNMPGHTVIKLTKIKTVTRDKEGHYIIIKGSIQKEDITIINIYATNIGAPQYIRQMLTAIKGETDSKTQ